MDLDSLANIGEFAGGIVLVISLVYLAYQVRQNTNPCARRTTLGCWSGCRRCRLSSAWIRNCTTCSWWAQRIQPGSRGRIGSVSRGPSTSSSAPANSCSISRATRPCRPAVWARWEATIGWWLSHPGMRAWWAAKPAPLAPDFEAFGDEVLRGNRGTIRRRSIAGVSFVAGEGLPPSRSAAGPVAGAG